MSTTSRRISEKMKGIGRIKKRGGGTNIIPKSATKGSAKGDSCQADWKKRYYLSKDNKAYKEQEYSTYYQMAITLNRG